MSERIGLYDSQPWRRGKTYTEAEMGWAIALVRNVAEQGNSPTIAPTYIVLADMLEQLLRRTA